MRGVLFDGPVSQTSRPKGPEKGGQKIVIRNVFGKAVEGQQVCGVVQGKKKKKVGEKGKRVHGV